MKVIIPRSGEPNVGYINYIVVGSPIGYINYIIRK